MPLEPASLQFLGAAGTVTGSMHVVRVGDRRVLLDCGLFQGLSGEPFQACDKVAATFRHAGHILGASTVDLKLTAVETRRVVFSGDLGRWDRPILPDPEPVKEADVLLLESTYGDRVHATNGEAELARIVGEAAKRGGALLVPAFAVGRTQELVWWLDRLEQAGRIPRLPLYLDSPMAIDVTRVHTRHPEDLDPDMRSAAGAGGHLLGAKKCHLARTVEESKRLNAITGPVIIATSGMATGGRILHHLSLRLPDPRTTVLLVGFQAAGTRGRALREAARTLRMFGGTSPWAPRSKPWTRSRPTPTRTSCCVGWQASLGRRARLTSCTGSRRRRPVSPRRSALATAGRSPSPGTARP